MSSLNFSFLTVDMEISRKKLCTLILLFSSNFVVFYLFHGYLLEEILLNSFDVWIWVFIGKVLFYSFIVISTLIGSLLSQKVERRKFLFFWISLGVVTISISTISYGIMFTIFISILLGISFGLGSPACFAYLADSTLIEERGRVSGILVSLTFIMLPIIIYLTSLFSVGLKELVYLSAILKATSFSALLFDPYVRKTGRDRKWSTILTSKPFILYFLPWLMFQITNGILIFVEMESGKIFQYLAACSFAFLSGVMTDHYGRKQPLILGFIALGLSYAFVGIDVTPFSWMVMMAISGIAWIFIMVSYMWTILGDLAPPGSSEKYYAIGSIIPILVEAIFNMLSGVLKITVKTSLVTPSLSVILFVSVFPLLFAPETLPESKIRDKRFRNYVLKAKKLVEDAGNIE